MKCLLLSIAFVLVAPAAAAQSAPTKVPDGTFLSAATMVNTCARNAMTCIGTVTMVARAAKTQTTPAHAMSQCVAVDSLDLHQLTMRYMQTHDVSRMRAIDVVRAALDQASVTICP